MNGIIPMRAAPLRCSVLGHPENDARLLIDEAGHYRIDIEHTFLYSAGDMQRIFAANRCEAAGH
jgi:hypothetical protein